MTTQPVNTTSSTNTVQSSNYNLTTSDFINMMITQLQNQDPTDPVKNSDLLAQMSQIGQLQSTSDLETSLKSFTLQNALSSAGSLIGKSVQGLDTNGAPISGLVTSVQVVDSNVSLELDNGQSLALANVTGITSAPTATATTTTK